jgi:hypothetical protein
VAELRNRNGHEKIVSEESRYSKRTRRRLKQSRRRKARESGGNIGKAGDFDLFAINVDKNVVFDMGARGGS